MEPPRVLSFINPATGEQFGELAMQTPDQVDQAIRELRAASKVWGNKTVQERLKILRKFQGVMIDSVDEISAVLNQDCGKTRQDALIEAFIVIDMLDQYLKRSAGWLRRRSVPRNIFYFKNFYIEHRPYGVVAVIAPWNYPFALALPPVLAALLAGNTVILKPSEVTAASGQMIENLFKRVPELVPFIRVVHGDGSVGEAMVRSRPDFIFLTGSAPTGQKVMRAAADHLIPVICELGGKGASIVLGDADLEAAAHWSVWGAFFNTGQSCVSVEMVYVVESVYDRFVELAVQEARKLRVGYTPEMECSFYLGPMTDPRQLKNIRHHLEDALEKGARVLVGGGIQNLYVEPTILVDVDHTMLVMRDETFGPLLPIMKVRDEEEALQLINASEYGLGGSIWSSDIELAQSIAHRMEVPTIAINDVMVQFGVPMLPFGGIKKSGYGRIHGKEGLMQFTTPYSYAIGNPPLSWDLTTVVRRPGNYRFIRALIHLAFGINARQRAQPVVEIAKLPEKTPGRKAAYGLGIASILGTVAGMALILSRRKSSRRE